MRPVARLRFLPFAAPLLLAVLAAACANKAHAPEDAFTPVPGTETLGIVSGDVVLNGRLYGSQNDTVVILSHMLPNDQRAWFPFAQVLEDNGYAALTFDFRGFGESAGSKDASTLDDDLSAVIGYIRGRGKTRIFLVGASMGATTSLVVASQEPVNGVVAISPPAKFNEQDGLAAVPLLSVPKLFIASVDDEGALQFDDLVAAAAEPKEVESYPGNEHGTALFEGAHAAEVRQRVLDFLQEQGGP